MSAVLVAENARDAQLREGSIGYPGAVGQQMRRSRSISPHRDPDSAPIRVVSVQRSVFCPSRGLLPSVLPSKGRVHRARFALGALACFKAWTANASGERGASGEQGTEVCSRVRPLGIRDSAVNAPPSPVHVPPSLSSHSKPLRPYSTS